MTRTSADAMRELVKHELEGTRWMLLDADGLSFLKDDFADGIACKLYSYRAACECGRERDPLSGAMAMCPHDGKPRPMTVTIYETREVRFSMKGVDTTDKLKIVESMIASIRFAIRVPGASVKKTETDRRELLRSALPLLCFAIDDARYSKVATDLIADIERSLEQP